MTEIYVANVSELSDPLKHPELLENLSEDRKQKIRNAKQKQKRLQSFGAGLLLNKVLARYGISSQDVYINDDGKPMTEGICFNLSHSGNFVICAVSNEPIGCDIQQIKEMPHFSEERFASLEEKLHLAHLVGDEYNREFVRIWTRKESYLKMLGIGLRVPLHALEIKGCYLKEFELSGYQICVCAKENEFSNLIWEKI